MNRSFAKVVTAIFHPLLMPLYGMLIIFSAPTLFGYLPFPVKRLLIIIVLFNNVLLPAMMIPFFKYRQIITSWNLEQRSERVIPMLITTLLYASTSIIMYRFPLPVFIRSFIIATFLLSLTLTVINIWWKISIHSAGAGALAGLVIVLSYKMHTPLLMFVAGAFLTAGMVLSSRLLLNRHNPAQVWTGFVTGFAVLLLLILVL